MVYQSRYLHFYQFHQYDLGELRLHIKDIFTPKWWFATSCVRPIWAIFFQTCGSYAWAKNVWQDPGTGVPAKVILPG